MWLSIEGASVLAEPVLIGGFSAQEEENFFFWLFRSVHLSLSRRLTVNARTKAPRSSCHLPVSHNNVHRMPKKEVFSVQADEMRAMRLLRTWISRGSYSSVFMTQLLAPSNRLVV